MKKSAIIFAFIIFASTTSFAQFKLDSYKCGTVSNAGQPEGFLYVKTDGVDEKFKDYYYEWKDNYLKIHEVRVDSQSGEIFNVSEFYLHYEDVKAQESTIMEENVPSIRNSKKNKPRFTVKPTQAMPLIVYSSGFCIKKSADEVSLPFANAAEFQAFITKIQDKAFDLALDLDKTYPRFTVEAGVSSEYDDNKRPTSSDEGSSSGNSSSNSSSEAKTEVTVEIKNKSNSPLEIYYKDNPKNSSKTSTSINARSSKRISIKVGGVVYSASGQELLRITADMDDTEQIIAK
jgi:hypothetical protein